MSARPFAVFDIDGTLVRWQLYHALADALLRQGVIKERDFEPARIARMNWKRRSNQDSYTTYERELVKVFSQALIGLPEHAFETAAQTVFSEHKDQVYTFTRDLIKSLKEQGYLLFAVSGSPALVVQKLTAHYGFDDFAASEYPLKNGYYTGEEILSVGRKASLLQQLIAKHGAGAVGSVAVGDSEGDIDMLELAEKPIAFNPTAKLYAAAEAHAWPIVLERKNMIYKLEPSSSGYKLNKR